MYEPVTANSRELLIVRILMTVCVMEFFGPWIKDFSASHLFNPDWVGHARLHMMWLLGFFLFSGIANLILIWFVRPLRLANLYIAFMWIGSNMLGFWLAVVMIPQYDGLLVVPHYHVMILGVEENLFLFSLLSIVYLAALALLHLHVRPKVLEANG